MAILTVNYTAQNRNGGTHQVGREGAKERGLEKGRTGKNVAEEQSKVDAKNTVV